MKREYKTLYYITNNLCSKHSYYKHYIYYIKYYSSIYRVFRVSHKMINFQYILLIMLIIYNSEKVHRFLTNPRHPSKY